jgi:hypothetical protein
MGPLVLGTVRSSNVHATVQPRRACGLGHSSRERNRGHEAMRSALVVLHYESSNRWIDVVPGRRAS